MLSESLGKVLASATLTQEEFADPCWHGSRALAQSAQGQSGEITQRRGARDSAALGLAQRRQRCSQTEQRRSRVIGGAVIHDEAIVDHLAFRREWVVQQMGLDPKSLVLITVRGDSMMGTIDHGDMVLLDVRPGQSYSDGIYIIQLSGALLCKRLHYALGGMVEVLSDNPKYAKEVLRAEELERLTVVGRVVWHGRRI